VADDNLIGNLVRARETYGGCEWRSYRLCGPRIYQPVKILPLGGAGQIAYVIPDIPDLRVHSRRDDMAAKEAAKEPPPKPISPLPISPKPPLVPSAESLGLLGKNGSAGQIVTMQDYMCNVITAIDELEGHSPYRLMKGGNGWAWRAPDIRPKE
jgi:hypothetical protein